jgi:RimJ/RimL family protein N-acetyltransferase
MDTNLRMAGKGQLPSLPDGTPVSWRFVVPSDRSQFEAAFHRMSPETRYQHFHTAADRLPPAVWDRLLGSIDQQGHIAVLIKVEDEPVAVGHLVRDPAHPRTADVAVTVADDWHGRGIGTLTLHQVLVLAGDIETIDTHVLADSRAALRLLSRLGPVTSECRLGQCRVRVDLRPHQRADRRSRPGTERTTNEGEAMSILKQVLVHRRDRHRDRKDLRLVSRATDEAMLLDPRAAGELQAVQST